MCNKLREIIADLCRKAHLSVRVEAGHGMCRDNNLHSRPADVLVEGWERGHPAALGTGTAHLCCRSFLKSWKACLILGCNTPLGGASNLTEVVHLKILSTYPAK